MKTTHYSKRILFLAGGRLSMRPGNHDRWIVGRMGYRYQGNQGLFLRFSPLMIVRNLDDPDGGIEGYWVAAAVGYSF